MSGGEDNDVKIWSVEQGKCIKVLKGHEYTVCITLITN